MKLNFTLEDVERMHQFADSQTGDFIEDLLTLHAEVERLRSSIVAVTWDDVYTDEVRE